MLIQNQRMIDALMMRSTKNLSIMDIQHLLSPSDSTPSHSFGPESISLNALRMFGTLSNCERGKAMASVYSGRANGGDVTPLSPPVTPGARRLSDVRAPFSDHDFTVGECVVSDPVLFPRQQGDVVTSPEPLFRQTQPLASDKPPDLNDIVSKHMSMQMERFSHCASSPTRDEYLLAASCVPIVSTKFNANPGKWYRQEQRILHERFGAANRVRKPSLGGQRVLAKLAPAPSEGARTSSPASPAVRRAPRSPRPPKRTPQTKALTSFDGTPNLSPKRVIGTSREDTEFDALPDFAPSPSTTLPRNNPKALKTDWKGQVLDLSRDPHRHLLHEAEVNLAATLRLSCATYLCSKRRIFMGRLDALRIGKEFRKTDSQQACKIDVNKASKLWAAYDRVGWFRAEHFMQFL